MELLAALLIAGLWFLSHELTLHLSAALVSAGPSLCSVFGAGDAAAVCPVRWPTLLKAPPSATAWTWECPYPVRVGNLRRIWWCRATAVRSHIFGMRSVFLIAGIDKALGLHCSEVINLHFLPASSSSNYTAAHSDSSFGLVALHWSALKSCGLPGKGRLCW